MENDAMPSVIIVGVIILNQFSGKIAKVDFFSISLCIINYMLYGDNCVIDFYIYWCFVPNLFSSRIKHSVCTGSIIAVIK